MLLVWVSCVVFSALVPFFTSLKHHRVAAFGIGLENNYPTADLSGSAKRFVPCMLVTISIKSEEILKFRLYLFLPFHSCHASQKKSSNFAKETNQKQAHHWVRRRCRQRLCYKVPSSLLSMLPCIADLFNISDNDFIASDDDDAPKNVYVFLFIPKLTCLLYFLALPDIAPMVLLRSDCQLLSLCKLLVLI